jgi:hypothetical protein
MYALNEVNRVSRFKSMYSESCFQTICHLQNNEYDVLCLQHITSQMYCNAIMNNNSFAHRCIKQYMGENVIWKVPKVANWQSYMIH